MVENKKQEEGQKKKWGEKQAHVREQKIEENVAKLVRILSTDIPGNKNIYVGLTSIKGISWGFSNAICNILGLDRRKKIQDLNEGEIAKIVEFIKNPKVPSYLLNSRKDFEQGKDSHIFGSDLDLKKEFDVKRLKKIRSYRGWRHALGQPVRGQRTKSHFRKNKAVGVGKKGK